MSEKEKRSEILQNQIDELKKDLAKLKTPTTESAKTSTTEAHDKKPHLTIEELLDCPDCGPKALAEAEKRLRPKIEKEIKEKHKSLKDPVICDDCGEIVEKTAEECPTCKGTKAH